MNPDGSFDVVLERPDSYVSWGFRLTGGSGATQPLNVQLVYDDTIADQVGLEIGDRIVKIGGQDVSGLSNFEAKRLVSQQGDRLCLRLRRRRGSVSFPVAAIKKSDSPGSVIATAQPARAQDAEPDVPPPTPPSPATAGNTSWSDRGRRTDLPNYQRGTGQKLEPWRPPTEPPKEVIPVKQREFRHSVPAMKPQTVQVTNSVAIPSAEAHVIEETISLNRPQSVISSATLVSRTANLEEDNGDRTKMPAYQRNLLLQPGTSPTLARRATQPNEASNVTVDNDNSDSDSKPQALSNQETSYPVYTQIAETSQSPSTYQRNVYRVSPSSAQNNKEPSDINKEINTPETFDSTKTDASDRKKEEQPPTPTWHPQVQPQPPTPTWHPPVQPQQQTFNIDYSQMALFPAYDLSEKRSDSPSSLPRSHESPNLQSPVQTRRSMQNIGNNLPSDNINRGSPASTLTRRLDPSNQIYNSDDQSRFQEEESYRTSLPAYQRDLVNRPSSGTRRGDSPNAGSPRWNSPGQPRKSFNAGDTQQTSTLPPYQRELASRVNQFGSLPRNSGYDSKQGWNSPSEPKQYENEEEAQLASLPAYQRDLLTKGNRASSLPRQSQTLTRDLNGRQGIPSDSHTDSDPSSSILPAYQRDLMNRLASSSIEPVTPRRPVSAVEQDWYESDRRFSVPAYQRDHLVMGSHFDKSASLDRRRGSSSEATQQNDNSEPPPRPMLAKTYTPSEVINCDICGNPVVGPFVRILSKYRMHPECVRCCMCGTCLMDTTRVMMDDKLFCEPHALEFAKPPGEDMVPVIVYPNAK